MLAFVEGGRYLFQRQLRLKYDLVLKNDRVKVSQFHCVVITVFLVDDVLPHNKAFLNYTFEREWILTGLF